MERARTYRDVAIEQMLETVAEAMDQVIDYWADLPAPMVNKRSRRVSRPTRGGN